MKPEKRTDKSIEPMAASWGTVEKRKSLTYNIKKLTKSIKILGDSLIKAKHAVNSLEDK
ncbi:hypothetical protein LCGC14_0370810 [marine sediment metagenome]|uniref:Uncharacterized protein n=1 Tax=marine sediment metagenome TaxID=412755 RepID=A0A0F9T5B5_9ZZZZ|nr:hypothetical protein [Maribacter sp.]